MPSILFVSLMAGSSWGGSEELWYRTALLAQCRGWKIGCALYYWADKEIKIQPLKEAGAGVYYFPNKGRTKRNLIERIQNKISKWKIKKVIANLPVKDYDVVVINQGAFENTTPAWRSFYKKHDRYLVLYHNYKEREVLKGVKKATVQNWITHAKANLFASRRIIEVLENNSGLKLSNAEILLNPISFPVPSHPSPYPSLKNGGYCFVMLAALEVWRKAQDNLVNALSSEKWKQRNWTLYLYGEGKDHQKLTELINSKGLKNKIFLPGHSKDVKAVLENAHLLLQITHIDAMRLSVVEAMAVGRPVVVSRIGDMPYWVNEGENGWISKDASVEEIGQTMEKAWQQKEQWPQIGANAFAFFQKKFTGSAEEKLLQRVEAAMK